MLGKKLATTTKRAAGRPRGRAPFWLKDQGQPRLPVEERVLSIFQPDILIENQYQSTYRRRFHLDPERVLMLAVLQDAVVCFQDNVKATCKRKQMMHLDAAEWIAHEDHSYPFSFDNVCEALGYDADYMRQGLLRWKEAILGGQSKKDNHGPARSRDTRHSAPEYLPAKVRMNGKVSRHV